MNSSYTDIFISAYAQHKLQCKCVYKQCIPSLPHLQRLWRLQFDPYVTTRMKQKKKPLVKQSEANFAFWPTLLTYNEMKFLPSCVLMAAEIKQKALPRESEHWKRKTL